MKATEGGNAAKRSEAWAFPEIWVGPDVAPHAAPGQELTKYAWSSETPKADKLHG